MPKATIYPKICPVCKVSKPKDEYGLRQDSTRTYGFKRKSYCGECQKKYESLRTHGDREAHSKRCRKSRLKLTFGLTEREYLELEVEHNHFCAICSRVAILGLDHCHKTGKVRGFLCKQCNTVLGMAKDDIGILEKCIEYLKKHSPTNQRHN